MTLTYREDFWDNAAQKAEFVRLLIDMFNVDLSLWDKKGLWDRRFRPFAYFDGAKIASNVCVYSMDMTVARRRCRAAQISSVATSPEYQRRGLSRDLMEKAMAWARDTHDFFFLFADDDAFPFYRKCGFRRIDEYKARIAVSGRRPIAGVRKLNVENGTDLKLADDLARRRAPVSELLGVTNHRLFMFWLLGYLNENAFYIEEEDLLVLCERKGEVLTVTDIVGTNIPTFSDIYPYIAAETDRAVEFLFVPDNLKLNKPDWVKVTRNGLHLLGDFPLENNNFIFPLTSHA